MDEVPSSTVTPEGSASSADSPSASGKRNDVSSRREDRGGRVGVLRAPGGTRTPSSLALLPRWARLPMGTGAGWIATALATLLAACIRLPGLGMLKTLVFDETYYVKDAWSLLALGYEGEWAKDVNPAFLAGDTSGLSSKAGYVVHPQTGKWLIALGMKVFGQTSPVGWRITAACAGILLVLLTCRIAWNLFRSPTITLLAGVFLATDGIAIVMSRTALLDIFLATFVAGAFLAVIKDQQQSHPLLVSKLSSWQPDPARPEKLGPHSGGRWWLVLAGVLLGLASSVKWSGIYALAVLGLFVAFRDWMTRRRFRHPRAFYATAVNDTSVAFLAMVPTAILTYIASWWSWFAHPQAWGHHAENTGLLGNLSDLWDYHVQMWKFHTSLTSDHSYKSNPLFWLLQQRPTSFAWDKVPQDAGCPTSQCVHNVVALGNPALWWAGVLALIVLLWATLVGRNWRTGLIVCGYLAMYVPWIGYMHRTIFNFYTIAFVAFVALAVAWLCGLLLDQARISPSPDRGYGSDDWDEVDYRWMGRTGIFSRLASSTLTSPARAFSAPGDEAEGAHDAFSPLASSSLNIEAEGSRGISSPLTSSTPGGEAEDSHGDSSSLASPALGNHAESRQEVSAHHASDVSAGFSSEAAPSPAGAAGSASSAPAEGDASSESALTDAVPSKKAHSSQDTHPQEGSTASSVNTPRTVRMETLTLFFTSVSRRTYALLACVLMALILGVAFFFLPLWRGDLITYDFWHIHMWFPSWI